MRTTVRLNDELLRRAKTQAAATGRTLTALLEDALRRELDGGTAAAPEKHIRIPTSGEGGLLPGVDLDDTAALLGRMESDS
jgi:hypothetical protein